MKKALFLLCCFPFLLQAQNSCDSAAFINDTLNVYLNTDSVLWLKFKAKGNKLDIQVVNSHTGMALDYSIFNQTSCDVLLNEKALPVRKISKGLSFVSEEKWNLLEEKGYCACEQCFSKIVVDEKSKLKLEQNQIYLIKVESNHQDTKIHLQFSEKSPAGKTFVLQSTKEDLAVGMSYQLQDVHFKESSMEYSVPNPPELDELLQFLKAVPSLFVEVQGHVNGPFNSDPALFLIKSLERAQKIKQYLVAHGISSERISTKGLGNTKMRYPKPKNEQEKEQNRRIEVIITRI